MTPRKYGVLVLGAVLTVVGAVLMLTQPIQVGSVAYAPLDGAVFVPPGTTAWPSASCSSRSASW